MKKGTLRNADLSLISLIRTTLMAFSIIGFARNNKLKETNNFVITFFLCFVISLNIINQTCVYDFMVILTTVLQPRYLINKGTKIKYISG